MVRAASQRLIVREPVGPPSVDAAETKTRAAQVDASQRAVRDLLEPGAKSRGGADWQSLADAIVAQHGDPPRLALAREILEQVADPAKRPRDAAILLWACGTGRDDVDTEGLVTPLQAARALQALAGLPATSRAAVEAHLAAAESLGHHAVLLKLVAAHHPLTDPADPSELQAAMGELVELSRGRDLAWLVEHTTAYGLLAQPGVQQAFDTGCGPSIALVARAECDPLLALRLSLDPAGQGRARSRSAAYEKQLLNEAGSDAVPRRLWERLRDGKLFANGTPTKLADYIREAYTQVGVRMTPLVWEGRDPVDRRAHLDGLERAVRSGVDLPLEEAKARKDGHFELLVDCRTLQGQRTWRIHDPWTGKSRWLDDAALISGTVGARGRTLVALWVPQ